MTLTPQSRTAAVDPQALEDLSLPSAAVVETVCAASVCATAVTLEKSGESCVSVTTSTVCATRGNCAQVRFYELKLLFLLSINLPVMISIDSFVYKMSENTSESYHSHPESTSSNVLFVQPTL